MLLEFRTKPNSNGHSRYLAVDINNRQYSKEPAHWLSKDIPVLRSCDIDHLADSLELMNFTRHDGPIMGGHKK